MATERFRLSAAPGGLALVQEVLNTRKTAKCGGDLLAEDATGVDWLRMTVRGWAEQLGDTTPPGEPDGGDLAPVRDLRTRLVEAIEARNASPDDGGPSVRVPAELLVSADGGVRLGPPPAASWGEWLESAVWGEVLLAQRGGTWPRLKLCREPLCASAFYDLSRNNSGVWHDVKVCGNAANLRASRQRRKQAVQEAARS